MAGANLPHARVITAAFALAVVAVGIATIGDNTYSFDVVTPAADGLVKGSEVRIGGQNVGKVTALGVEGDQARLSLEIDDDSAPLHAGTDVHVAMLLLSRAPRAIRRCPRARSSREPPSAWSSMTSRPPSTLRLARR